MLSPVFCNLRVMTYGKRLESALTITGKDRKALARELGISTQAVGQVITAGADSSKAFTAKNNALAARYLRVNSHWLATGEGQMLDELPTADANETSETKGPELMRTALNILAICLHDMDTDSRTEAGYLLQKMAENPGGRWSARLGDMVENEAEPYLWTAICNSDRVGKYPLSSRNDPPRMSSKSGSAQTKAIQESNRPTGPDDASAGEDRNKDQNRGGSGAARSG